MKEIHIVGTESPLCTDMVRLVEEVIREHHLHHWLVVRDEDASAFPGVDEHHLPSLLVDGQLVVEGGMLGKEELLSLLLEHKDEDYGGDCAGRMTPVSICLLLAAVGVCIFLAVSECCRTQEEPASREKGRAQHGR